LSVPLAKEKDLPLVYILGFHSPFARVGVPIAISLFSCSALSCPTNAWMPSRLNASSPPPPAPPPAAPVNPLAQPARGSVVVTSTVRGLRTLFLASRSQQRERTWERWERISLYPLLLVAAPLVYLEFASTSDRHRASLASKGSLLGAILPASVSDLLGLRRAPAEEGEAGRAR